MSDPVNTRVTSNDGTSIAVDRYGDGPALVLVGGAFQYREFDPPTVELAGLLSSDFAVFHYDRRGRGDSGDTGPYEPSREIEDLGAVIEYAGGSAAVFGNSSGGVLALDSATSLPITKLALYEVPFIVDRSRPPIPNDYLAQLAKLLSEDRQGDMVELFMTTVIGMPGEMVAGMRQSPMWAGFEAAAHTLLYDGAFMEGTQRGKPLETGRWSGVEAPTLVVDGGDSQPWIHFAADALARELGHSERLTLAGQSHTVAPDVLASALRGFLIG